jgi:hypothetical protein
MHCDVLRGPHLGRKIKWLDLPESVRVVIIRDMQEDA